jgi:hypothetical protein
MLQPCKILTTMVLPAILARSISAYMPTRFDFVKCDAARDSPQRFVMLVSACPFKSALLASETKLSLTHMVWQPLLSCGCSHSFLSIDAMADLLQDKCCCSG